MHDNSNHPDTLRSVCYKKGVCVCIRTHTMSLLTLLTWNIVLDQLSSVFSVRVEYTEWVVLFISLSICLSVVFLVYIFL